MRAGVAARLRNSIDAWWLASTDGARGTSSEELAARIEAQIAAPLNLAGNIAAACAAALAAAGPLDRIVVFGSFHTVGPAMDWLEARGMLPPDSASRIYWPAARILKSKVSMERPVKERLVGATILVALIVLIVPEMLSGPKRPASAPPSARIFRADAQCFRRLDDQ